MIDKVFTIDEILLYLDSCLVGKDLSRYRTTDVVQNLALKFAINNIENNENGIVAALNKKNNIPNQITTSF